MKNDDARVVTAETLMRRIEELLLMDEVSEGEKSEILIKVLSVLEMEG